MSSIDTDITVTDATDLVAQCYTDYGKYVLATRALPSVYDGMKAVHRRLVYSGHQLPNKMTKSINIIGHCSRYHPHGDCLDEDTRVLLTNGEIKTMLELYEQGTDQSIYAVNHEGNIVTAKAHSFRIGQYASEVYSITLSNGSVIKCTGNHPWLLLDQSWVTTESLNQGDELFSGIISTGNSYLTSHPDVLYVERIDVTLTDRRPMYDFTVDDYQNMLIVTNEVLPNLYDFVVAHNSSLYSSLVSITMDRIPVKLFEGKGNWGGLNYGPAAPRYTEARLSEIAKLMYCQFVESAEYVRGETGYDEPIYLPSLIPYALVCGSYGIGVGLSSRIFPLDFIETIDYYIDKLEGKENPSIPRPNFGNVLILSPKPEVERLVASGQGSIRLQGIVYTESPGKFIVTDFPPDIYPINLVNKLKHYIDNDIVDYRDESGETERYVFEIVNWSKITHDQLKDILESSLRCSRGYTWVFSDYEKAVYCGIDHVVNRSLSYLTECCTKMLNNNLSKLRVTHSVLMAIEDMKSAGIVDKITKLTTDQLKSEITKLGYEMTVANEVVRRPISYLTRSHQSEIDNLVIEIAKVDGYLADIPSYLIPIYKDLRSHVMKMSRKRSLYSDEVLINPRVNLSDQSIKVSNSGHPYDSQVFVVDKSGNLYVKSVMTTIPATFSLLGIEPIGLSTDRYEHLVVMDSAGGVAAFPITSLAYDKHLVRTHDKAPEVSKAIPANDKVKLIYENGTESIIECSSILRYKLSYCYNMGPIVDIQSV